jgi:hypothetical protein
MPGKRFVIGVPYVWLFVFFFLPFLILLYISFVDMGESIHPFKPIWDTETGLLSLKYENYTTIFKSEEGGWFQTLYIEAYVRSVWYALCTAVLCLVLGYPFAYFIARSPASVRPALLIDDAHDGRVAELVAELVRELVVESARKDAVFAAGAVLDQTRGLLAGGLAFDALILAAVQHLEQLDGDLPLLAGRKRREFNFA